MRTTVARLLAYEVERLGASRVLSGQKDITDRILPAAAKLAQEGSLETRYKHKDYVGTYNMHLQIWPLNSSDLVNVVDKATKDS